jgi:hypothetical protein
MMGVLYFGVNHARKEVVILGKFTLLIDHEDTYSVYNPYQSKRIINVSDEILHMCDADAYGRDWRTFVLALRAFDVDEVFSDGEMDIDEVFPAYKFALSRFADDSDRMGVTVRDYYDNI